jgi:hypothetical protein
MLSILQQFIDRLIEYLGGASNLDRMLLIFQIVQVNQWISISKAVLATNRSIRHFKRSVFLDHILGF